MQAQDSGDHHNLNQLRNRKIDQVRQTQNHHLEIRHSGFKIVIGDRLEWLKAFVPILFRLA